MGERVIVLPKYVYTASLVSGAGREAAEGPGIIAVYPTTLPNKLCL
jgi:hypothetical protein